MGTPFTGKDHVREIAEGIRGEHTPPTMRAIVNTRPAGESGRISP